jgi:multiple sugar transport system substrate-binding protein
MPNRRDFVEKLNSIEIRSQAMSRHRLLALFAAAASVAGCGQAPEILGTNQAKTIVRISHWGGAGEDGEYERIVQRMYRDFEAAHPGVDVRAEGIPGEYVHKMLLNFVAGTQPDVMVLDASSAAVFVQNGLLEDLAPFIARDKTFRLDQYHENVVSIARRGDKVYAIPGDFTPMVLYYNKDLFDRAGVPYPRADWNFEEFLETARKLTVPGKQHGFVFSNWMPGWVMWLWNNGGDVLSPDGQRALGYLDSPANVETIRFLRDLVKKHRVAPSFSEVASLGVDPFANGQAAMTVSGHWSLVSYKASDKIDWRQLGVVALPHNTPEPHTVMYEAGYAIPRGAPNPDLAWELVKSWTSYELQSQYNASGIAVCARKDVSRERGQEEIERQFLDIVPSARPPWGARVEGYEAVERIGKGMMDSVLNTEIDVRVALRKAAERIDREFAKR